MKNITRLTFTALVAVAVTFLFQTPATQANDNGRGGNQNERGDHGRNPTVHFIKWVTSEPNLPGLLQNMEGVVDGDVGRGTFTGEVLKETITGDRDDIVAFYHFNGSKHSFSAVVHVDFNIATLKGDFLGVITEGWMKGHAIEGKMWTLESFQGHSPAFEAVFEIKD